MEGGTGFSVSESPGCAAFWLQTTALKRPALLCQPAGSDRVRWRLCKTHQAMEHTALFLSFFLCFQTIT